MPSSSNQNTQTYFICKSPIEIVQSSPSISAFFAAFKSASLAEIVMGFLQCVPCNRPYLVVGCFVHEPRRNQSIGLESLENFEMLLPNSFN